MNKLIKNVVVKSNLNVLNTGIITQQIHIPFEPSSVVVKYVTYAEDGLQTGYINSNLLNADDILAPISDQNALSLDVEYELNKPVSGTYEFYMRSMNGQINSALVGDVVLHLEFRKYLQ